MGLKENVLEALEAFLPRNALLVDEEVSLRKAGGLHTEEAVKAKVIVRPETTEEVSKIVKICYKNSIPIIPF